MIDLGEEELLVKKANVVYFTIKVIVTKPVIQKDLVIEVEQDANGENGVLTTEELASIFGTDSNTVTAVESLDADLVVALDGDNRIIFFKDEEGNPFVATGKSYKVVLYNATYGVELSIMPITKIIRTADEFVTTFSFGSDDDVAETIDAVTNLPIFNGYYLLANDIDFADKQMPVDSFTQVGTGSGTHNALYADGVSENHGLTGTFDGNGYSIKNLKVTRGGIFGVVSGTVKNVALIDISSQITDAKNGLIAGHIYSSGTLDNVYLTYNGTSNANVALIASNVGYNFNMTNCYFKGEIKIKKISVFDILRILLIIAIIIAALPLYVFFGIGSLFAFDAPNSATPIKVFQLLLMDTLAFCTPIAMITGLIKGRKNAIRSRL